MENIKSPLYTAGKILYKIAKFPCKLIVGNYNPGNIKIMGEIKELKNQVKSLDSELIETESESQRLKNVKENLYVPSYLN